jgi:hypothetical protein
MGAFSAIGDNSLSVCSREVKKEYEIFICKNLIVYIICGCSDNAIF